MNKMNLGNNAIQASAPVTLDTTLVRQLHMAGDDFTRLTVDFEIARKHANEHPMVLAHCVEMLERIRSLDPDGIGSVDGLTALSHACMSAKSTLLGDLRGEWAAYNSQCREERVQLYNYLASRIFNDKHSELSTDVQDIGLEFWSYALRDMRGFWGFSDCIDEDRCVNSAVHIEPDNAYGVHLPGFGRFVACFAGEEGAVELEKAIRAVPRSNFTDEILLYKHAGGKGDRWVPYSK